MTEVLFIATIQDERNALMVRADRITTTLAFFEPVLKDMRPKVMENGKSISYVKASPYIGERSHYIQTITDASQWLYNGGEINKDIVRYALDDMTHWLLQVLRQGWYEVLEFDEEIDHEGNAHPTGAHPKRVPLSGIVRVPAEYYLEWAKGFNDVWFLFSGGQVGKPFFENDKWEWRLVNGQP